MPDSPVSVRPEIYDFEPYSAGLSIDEIRDKYGLAEVIKLASNENPLGASPLARKAVERAAASMFRYTQSGNPRLAAAVAARHNLPARRIVLGNGSDEVIDLLIRCRAVPGRDNVVCFKPCFSLYPLQSRLCGVELRQAPLREDFSFDWDALLALTDANTALVFVTMPDNPSGYCPPREEVAALARRLPAGALLVLDEAYIDFADGGEEASSLLPRLEEFPNLAFLRTFSKYFGLAGLRLGYGILPEELADYLCRVRPPFSVNILAEAAGLAVLQDSAFLRASREAVLRGRAFLAEELANLGCKVFKSQSNFLMFGLPEGGAPGRQPDTKQVFDKLLEQGIIIRRLLSYGLPQYLRVSVGNEHENKAFIRALRDLLKA